VSSQNSYAIILLAAGSSSRLGQAKQLLPFGENTLLEHVISIAKQTNVSQVIVIVNDALKNISPGENITLVVNEDAAKGLATSIKKGIACIHDRFPEITAAIIMPCDQPFVSAAVLNELILQHEQSGKGIIAARYAETYGTPALLHHTYFEELLLLTGDTGAKPLMKQHVSDISFVDFPQGDIDIDIPEDLKNIGIKQ
jgi:molybdenum cofactor cytidylyltransferase